VSKYPWAAVAVSALLCASCAGPAMQVPGMGVELPTQLPGVGADEVAAEKRRQQILTVQNFAAQSARLENVAHRLLVANWSDCKSAVTPRIGWQVLSPHDFDLKNRSIVADALRLDAQRPTVVTVVDGGPAARAGVAVGDQVVAINGRRIFPVKASESIALLTRWSGLAPMRVEILRQGKPHTLTVNPELGCAIPVLMTVDLQPNAYTNGRQIVIHSGVMRVASTDAELAAVVGHELAHVTMGHLLKRAQNQIAGIVGNMILGAAMDFDAGMRGVDTKGGYTRGLMQGGAFTMATEREADYVGTYYSARAGYDAAAGEKIWRALAQDNPEQIHFAGMHPTAPERIILMQKTAQEIAEKKKRNLPLVPELKTSQATAPPLVAGGGQ
jgi:hypothetical protein